MTKPNPADLIWLVEHIVAATEAAGEEQFTIPTHVARALLEMAKRAPRSREGRPPVPGRVKVRDAVTVHRARSHKAKLLAEAKAEGRPLTADAATWKAAKEAALRSRLSATEIRERMQRRSRR
jgi:hypothetical protein